MSALRAGALTAAIALVAVWCVALAPRMTVGAADLSAPRIVLGAIPSPSALPPLVIPQRDPFAADVASPRPLPPHAGALAALASTMVPDIAELGRRSEVAGLGVIATITSSDDAYALIEAGADVRVVRVGDAAGGSRIVQIREGGVVLADGLRIGLAAAQAIAGGPLTDEPPVVPDIGAHVRGAEPAAIAGPAPTSVPAVASPVGSAPLTDPLRAAGSSGWGATVLTNPDGTLVTPQPNALLVPSAFATPSIIVPGALPSAAPLPAQGGTR